MDLHKPLCFYDATLDGPTHLSGMAERYRSAFFVPSLNAKEKPTF